jgi:hypothetical protein
MEQASKQASKRESAKPTMSLILFYSILFYSASLTVSIYIEAQNNIIRWFGVMRIQVRFILKDES